LITINATDLEKSLDYVELADNLAKAFLYPPDQPSRHHHTIHIPDRENGTLLLMPAWRQGKYMGVKIVTIFPSNAFDEPPLPSVVGQYILMDANSGIPLALINGTELTLRRTAATSALAARYFACQNARKLLMVGSGALARHLVRAHLAVRPIESILVWSRNSANASQFVSEILSETGIQVSVTEDLKDACKWAQIISCATLSEDPLVRGRWLNPGTHLDLVGAFKPEMRETDAEAIARSCLYVDTMSGALAEAGDIIQALQTGVISKNNIIGELSEVISGKISGRKNETDITCFKSVGASLEDLAAATLAFKKYT
tara:strand:- start:1779 stop:2726 length:948 start_codon:yes stop_codon:yes gene_type:complete